MSMVKTSSHSYRYVKNRFRTGALLLLSSGRGSNLIGGHYNILEYSQTWIAMFCACLFICALWSPAGKGLTSWLSFVVSSVSLSLSHWYPGSGVVLDCIDS